MRVPAVLSRIGAIRAAAVIAILATGGVLAAHVLVPEVPPPPPAESIPVPPLRVAGRDVTTEGDAVGNALDLVRRYAMGDVKLRLPDGATVDVNRAEFGLEIDRLRLAEFVKEALLQGSPVGRARAQLGAEGPVDVPLPITIDGERAIAKLVEVKAKTDKLPQDAVVDLDKRLIKPEVDGYQLDVYATLARLEAGFRRGETVVDVVGLKIKPKRVAEQLKGIDFDTVLGWFETRYNTDPRYKDRTDNLRLATTRLDGMVLMPGEEFDFNAVVGPRDEAHGYKVAPVIAQGELVDGIGGGTCQVSGTLHAAAFFAGLEIVERYPHSRPSSYLPLGLDATVSYPNITYRFKNPFDFPIVLHEKVAGGVVRAEILGPSRKLTVSYFRRIDDILPFEEVERETDKLPVGERVVTQRGVPGFVATASRLVRDGAYGERTKWREKYPPTTQIVAVGTGPEDKKPGVKQDNHLEYVVDEYRVMTQGPNVRSKEDPSGGMSDSRVPGKTGEAGWIRKLGFEKTPIDPPDDEDKDKEKDKEKDDAKKSSDKKDASKEGKSKSAKDKKPEAKKKDEPKKKDAKKKKDGKS